MQGIISIIEALLPATRLAGLTLSQWVGIVGALEAAEPQIVAAIAALHPLFTAIVNDLATGTTAPSVAANALLAAQTPQDQTNAWMDRFGAGSQS